jgi:hypothetical protein
MEYSTHFLEMVHEGCTVQNTNQINESGECAYWAYGGKEIVRGGKFFIFTGPAPGPIPVLVTNQPSECWKWDAPPDSGKKTTIDCLKD